MRPTLLASLAILAAACGSPPPPEPPPAPPAPPPVAHPPVPASPPPAATTTAATPSPAEADELAGVPIKVQKVAGVVYVLYGAGGNIAISAGDDGIVIVDDQFAPLTPRILEALRGITDKRVRFVFNTHWHGDHTGGNAAFFTATGAAIVAHENVRKRLIEGMGARESHGEKIDAAPPAPHEALPVVTFRDRVSIHFNGEEIRAIHLPTGHTDGDVVVYFTKSNVVHMGDDFVTYGFPFVDLQCGGSVRGLTVALDKIVAELPADVKVIPGHGEVATLDDVKKLDLALEDCIKIVEAEVKKKRTLSQIQAAKVLAKHADLDRGEIKADDFIATLYEELTRPTSKPR